MRIGITMLSHDPTWGGIGVYTRQVVRNLLAVDPDDEYVLIYPQFGHSREHMGEYEAAHENVTEVETRRSLHWTTYWDQVVVPGVARAHEVDLLFNPFWSVPVFADYKTVMTVHGIDSHVVPESLSPRDRFEWALHARLWVHRADAVISISDMMTRDLVRFDHLPVERIRRIYHGCGEHFRPIRERELLEAARRRFRLPERFILFVGRLFPQKNFQNLLRAFHAISDRVPHALVVVGQPRWKYGDDLRLVQELGLKQRVHLMDHVANEDLPALYSLADCFAFPSLYEAFGLVGVEAMACGCPVAAARAGALPEVLGDAAVFYDPQDVDEMAERLLTVLCDESERSRCIQRGLERAREFTWRRTATETLRLFRELAG